MVRYKLLYFNIRARGEAIRYILAQAGIQYEDNRVDMDEWLAMKSKMPMGQLPVLEVDGQQLCQSVAIARYLATEHSLIPSDHWLSAKADMLVDGVGDQISLLMPFVRAMLKRDKSLALVTWTRYKSEHLPPFMDKYEKFLMENGGEYFVGDRLSWTDLVVAEFIDRLVMTDKTDSILTNYDGLRKHIKHIHDLPNIKKYVDGRPKTIM